MNTDDWWIKDNKKWTKHFRVLLLTGRARSERTINSLRWSANHPVYGYGQCCYATDDRWRMMIDKVLMNIYKFELVITLGLKLNFWQTQTFAPCQGSWHLRPQMTEGFPCLLKKVWTVMPFTLVPSIEQPQTFAPCQGGCLKKLQTIFSDWGVSLPY